MVEPLGPVQIVLECSDEIRTRAVLSELSALERRGQKILTAALEPGLPTIRLVWTHEPEAAPTHSQLFSHVTLAVIHRRMAYPDSCAAGYDAVLWDDQVEVAALLPWCGVAALRHRMQPAEPSIKASAPITPILSSKGPKPPRSSAPVPAPATIRLKGKILVADDTPSTRDFLRFVLTSAGAEVVLAENGAEAVELASLACPDLVLIDIEMPVLNGYDAISQLRARGVRAPILVLSGHMDEEQKRRSDQVGATGFISKNHTKREILRALAAYVSGSGEGERPSLSQDQTSAYARLALKYLDRFDSTVPKALVAAQKGEWRKLQELIHPLAAGTMFGFQRLTEGVREVAAALCALQDAQALARERVQKLSELGSSIDNDRTRLRQLVSPVAELPEEVKTPDLALLPDSE